jgi:hypothetical protein
VTHSLKAPGLYKLNAVVTHSLKAPGFNPRASKVKNLVSSLCFFECNLYRYTLAPQENGFYVLNDIIRFVEPLSTTSSKTTAVTSNGGAPPAAAAAAAAAAKAAATATAAAPEAAAEEEEEEEEEKVEGCTS